MREQYSFGETFFVMCESVCMAKTQKTFVSFFSFSSYYCNSR